MAIFCHKHFMSQGIECLKTPSVGVTKLHYTYYIENNLELIIKSSVVLLRKSQNYGLKTGRAQAYLLIPWVIAGAGGNSRCLDTTNRTKGFSSFL